MQGWQHTYTRFNQELVHTVTFTPRIYLNKQTDIMHVYSVRMCALLTSNI